MSDVTNDMILQAVRESHETAKSNHKELLQVEKRVENLEGNYKLLHEGTHEALDHMRRRNKESLEALSANMKDLAEAMRTLKEGLFVTPDALGVRLQKLEQEIIPDGRVRIAGVDNRFANIELKFREIEKDIEDRERAVKEVTREHERIIREETEKREKKAARWFGWTVGTAVVAVIGAIVGFIMLRLGMSPGR